MFSYFHKNALQFTKLILKLAEFSNTAGSKVASRSPTIGWEWTPHVLQDRRRCREQSLLLRSWSQAVCHVCHVFHGDKVDIGARLHLKVNLERAQTASHSGAVARPPSLTRFFLQEVILNSMCWTFSFIWQLLQPALTNHLSREVGHFWLVTGGLSVTKRSLEGCEG